jgi:hypothetical protein
MSAGSVTFAVTTPVQTRLDFRIMMTPSPPNKSSRDIS